jgi:hypothetical protein
MPGYERLFPIAMLACIAAGAWSYLQADALSASHDFLAAAIAMRLDERLRQRWWVIDEDDELEWQRLRTPAG